MSAAFIAFGEALTDLLRLGEGAQWLSQPGGACWNVARASAALGLASGFAGAISRDVFGQQLLQASQAAGLDLAGLQQVDAPPLLAVVEGGAAPRYFFIGEGSADLRFDPEALPAGWDAQLRWAHFGGISLVREPLGSRLFALAQRLKARGVRISYDPNHRVLMQAQRDRPRLLAMSALADLVKVSDEDLLGFFPEMAPEDSLAALRAQAPQARWLHTRGAAGASYWLPGQAPITRPAPPVRLVDAVGAGDACLAALICAWQDLAPDDPARQLDFALAAAALACEGAGALAPSRAAVLQRLGG